MSANRRSTPPILACAYQAIKCNPEIVSTGDGGWPREPLSCARLEREPQLAAAPAVQASPTTATSRKPPSSPTPSRPCGSSDLTEAQRHRRALSQPSASAQDRCRAQAPRHSRARQGRRPVQHAPAARCHGGAAHSGLVSSRCAVSRGSVAAVLCRSGALSRRTRASRPRLSRQRRRWRKFPAGCEVIETIRQARQNSLDANNALRSAMDIAQRAFQLPESMPLRRLQDFAERWSEKPKQIVGEGTLHDFLDYLSAFSRRGRRRAGGRNRRRRSGCGARPQRIRRCSRSTTLSS